MIKEEREREKAIIKEMLERIDFEEDWFSLVDLTEENVKMVFRLLRDLLRNLLRRIEKEGIILDKMEVRSLRNLLRRIEKEGTILDITEVIPLEKDEM